MEKTCPELPIEKFFSAWEFERKIDQNIEVKIIGDRVGREPQGSV